MFSCYRDHYSICKSVWWRWCALIFHRQRKKERARGNTYYEYVVFACMFQCFVVNDDRTFILPSDSDAVWSIQKCNGLCTSVSDGLSDWYASIYGCSWHESIYQRTGLFAGWYAFGCNRCSCESDFRSSVYLCIWNGSTWCGVCNCNFTVFVCIVCILFFDKKSRVKGAATKEK